MRAGHDVHVWAAGTGENARAGTGERGHTILVTRFASRYADLSRKRAVSRLFFHAATDAAPRRDVVREIVTWKPDALLTHNLTGCGMGTPRAIQRHGVRWTHTLHDIQLTDPSGQETVEASRTWRRRMIRWAASRHRQLFFGLPDVVVSPTRWLLDWHRRQGFFLHATTVVIPNPIDVSTPRERTLTVPSTIAYVGRLSMEKGFGTVIQMIPQLPTSLVGKIVIVSGGPMMKEAERIRDARVDVRGAVSFEDAHRAISAADLLIAPSRILENQQTVLLQAMSEGTPAVATDTGGTKETLEGTGCPVVPPGDATALAEAITRLLSDPDAWHAASRAMRHCAERHDPARYVSELTVVMAQDRT